MKTMTGWPFLLLLPLCMDLQAIEDGGKAGGRPDIVLVLADDQTWSDSGCYGNRQVRTPNIDRLAAEGMRFTRAFTATAMCAPTRQQLYTGLFPVRNGAYPNHSKVKPGTRSIVHFLRKLGYRVGLSGKKHFGPPDSFPFENVPGRSWGNSSAARRASPIAWSSRPTVRTCPGRREMPRPTIPRL